MKTLRNVNSLFFKSCTHGLTKVVKLLIDNGADVTAWDNLSIRGASINGHLEVVKLLIDNGADVTAWDNLAIKCASKCGRVELVNLLKKHGAKL